VTRLPAVPLALLLGLCACAAPAERAAPAPEPEPGSAADPATHIVLAWLDDQPLTLRDALDTFLTSHASHGGLVRGEPAVRELAGRIIERRLFLAEAHALGVDQDPDLPRIVDDYHVELTEMAFWKQEVADKVQVSDAEVEAFWDKTDVALDLTLVLVPERALAEELRARAEAGADLGALAREHSTHPTRDFDGQLGFVRRGELDRGLEGPAFELQQPGALTPVVAVRDGFAFARLDRRTVNPERPPREMAIPQIRNVLEARAEDELRTAVEERVRAEAGAEVDATRLDKATLLGEGDGEAVVARAAGEVLTLQGFRDLLQLDAVRAADEATVAQAARDLAADWALRASVKHAVRRSGLMQRPDLARKAGVFRDDAVIKMLCDRYIYAGIELDDADVRAWYDGHVATEFTRPPEVLLGCILLAGDEEAQAALQRLREGEDFAALARELSRDPSTARNGGRAGWVRPGSVLPEVEASAFALQPGELAGPIATESGPFVVTVFERRESQVVPFEVARDAARRQLAKARQKEAYATWALRLKERAVTSLDADGVQRAVAWLDEQAAQEQVAEDAARAERAAAAEEAGPSPHGAAAPHGAQPPGHPGGAP